MTEATRCEKTGAGGEVRRTPGTEAAPLCEGVVLAAGLSSRAGAFKLTLPFAGGTLIEAAVSGLLTCCRRIWVVVGHRREEIREILQGYPAVCFVENPDYCSGMFSSVQAGVRRVEAEAFFLLPGDLPLVESPVYKKMVQIMVQTPGGATGADIFIPLYQGRKGHPVLFRGPMAARIAQAPPDAGLRDIIAAHGFTAVPTDCPGVLLDVDTPGDYQRVSSLPKGAAVH